jgi:hypothetical protein
MDGQSDNQGRLFVSTDGVDFDDDASIRMFAERVWQLVADQGNSGMGECMTQSTQRAPRMVLTDRYADAVAYATQIHGGQVRKGTDTTYLCHLLGVSALVIEAGGSEDQAIAGLLHDAVEDAGGPARAEEIGERFGVDVRRMVLACSDSTDEDWKRNTPYWVRKSAYLAELEVESADAVLVSIADKVHNCRAIVTDLKRGPDPATGIDPLAKFTATSEEMVEYYSTMLRIGVAKGVPDTLTIPLELALRELVELLPDYAAD